MKVLVTGGAGYIGSVTSRILQTAGHDVTVLDNLSHGHRDSLPGSVRFIRGSIGDLGMLVKPSDGFDAVVHLAGLILVGDSMRYPNHYWHNNFVQTLQMLEEMRTLSIRKLIFASTAAVYGNTGTVPITEDSPKNPTSTYGMTKLAADMAITSETWANDLAATSLRFFNVAGAHKHAGERHPTETHLIPLAFDVASGKRERFSLFGTDYKTRDGTCIRDYIHVIDLAKAIVLALEKLQPSTHSIYNLGNGSGFTNREVLAAVERVTGKKLLVHEEPRRAGDPAILVTSSKKAKDELGWQPEVSRIDDIIRDAWSFYITHGNPTTRL